jgi:hypothetical protein
VKYENEEQFEALAKELEEDTYPSPFKIEVIHRLRANAYHDFLNDRFATPKLQMINDFTTLNMPDVVERIKNGDFDQ